MADVIKKVVVENVPKVYSSGYTIRYRIISEDRNRVSHWSPIHTFDRNQASVEVGGEVSFISERQISASWEETNANSIYEVFIKWDYNAFYDDGNPDNNPDANLYASADLGWKYVRTVSAPNYSALVPIDPDTLQPVESVKVWIQQPTATKEYTLAAKVYSGEAINIFTS